MSRHEEKSKAAMLGIAAFVAVLEDKASAGEALTIAEITASAEQMVHELGGDWVALSMAAGLDFAKMRRNGQ